MQHVRSFALLRSKSERRFELMVSEHVQWIWEKREKKKTLNARLMGEYIWRWKEIRPNGIYDMTENPRESGARAQPYFKANTIDVSQSGLYILQMRTKGNRCESGRRAYSTQNGKSIEVYIQITISPSLDKVYKTDCWIQSPLQLIHLISLFFFWGKRFAYFLPWRISPPIRRTVAQSIWAIWFITALKPQG